MQGNGSMCQGLGPSAGDTMHVPGTGNICRATRCMCQGLARVSGHRGICRDSLHVSGTGIICRGNGSM